MKLYKKTNKKYLQVLDSIKELSISRKDYSIVSKFSNYATIIGAFTGIFFSIITLNLTCKYGENKDQINKLDTLARNQIRQDSSLIDIITALKEQNSSLSKEIGHLKELLGISSNQVTILGKVYSLQELRDSINKISEQLNYFHNIKQVRDSLNIFLYKNNPRMESPWLVDSLEHQKLWYEKAFNLLSNTRQIIKTLQNNPYAINSSKKLSMLTNFIKKIDGINSGYSYYDLSFSQKHRVELYDKISLLLESWTLEFNEEILSTQ